jgi:predicted Ser/Thr protein kinase
VPLDLPSAIGKFSILQSIAAGGMGRVYLGRDPEMDRLVAIKVLREGFEGSEFRDRFSREARSVSTLRHPNIVTIFETGTHEGQPFIVMEYIQGETLGQLVRGGSALSLERKLHMMDELCAGLHYAHRKNVIHRDIKPANIMIDEEGVLRILDFGIARLGAGGMTQTGAVMGTLNYMAPEQLAGKRVDGRADMFSAATVFYELLSSRRAFPGTFPSLLNSILNEEPEPLDQLCPGLDPSVVAFVNRCLKKDLTERYADLGAARDALSAIRRRLAITGGETMVAVPSLPDRAALRRIRGEQIQKQVDTARQAIDDARYEHALHACQQVLLLDPENEQALGIDERARAALEHQQLLRQWLGEANEALGRGAVTAASLLVDRALSLNPDSDEARAVRQAVDTARRRLAEAKELEARGAEEAASQPPAGESPAAVASEEESHEALQPDQVLPPSAPETPWDLPLSDSPALRPVLDRSREQQSTFASLQRFHRPLLSIAMAAVLVVGSAAVWRWKGSRATQGVADSPATVVPTTPPSSEGAAPPPPVAPPVVTPVLTDAVAPNKPSEGKAPAGEPQPPKPTPAPPISAVVPAAGRPAARVPGRSAPPLVEAPPDGRSTSQQTDGSKSSSESPIAQTPPAVSASGAPAANDIQWIIRVDASCASTVSTVDVFIDDSKVGSLTPGRGMVKNVAPGKHAVSGLATAASWGPFTYELTQGVRTTSFSCN